MNVTRARVRVRACTCLESRKNRSNFRGEGGGAEEGGGGGGGGFVL